MILQEYKPSLSVGFCSPEVHVYKYRSKDEGCGDCLGLIVWLTFVTSLPRKAFILYSLTTVGKVPGGLKHRSQ